MKKKFKSEPKSSPSIGKKTRSEWDAVSSWYDSITGSEGSFYQRELVIPAVLDMLLPQKNDHILDAGCGNGVFTRKLAEKKIRCTGVDLSSELIREAVKKRKPDSGKFQRFLVNDASSMNDLKSDEFDGAVSILALQDMKDLPGTIAEITRTVKKNGTFVICIMHPCFRIPRQSHWGFDEKNKTQYRRMDRYLTPMEIPIQTHPGKNPNVRTTTYHRPLSEYINILNEFGWFINGMKEITSNKKSETGPRAKAENRAREEIPMFLCLSAVKYGMPNTTKQDKAVKSQA